MWVRSEVCLGRPVQVRFGEAQQCDDRQRHDGYRHQVGDSGAGDPGHDTAEESADDESSAVDEPVAAEVVLERGAVAGLLQHRVVDEGVDRPGTQCEAHTQRQRAEGVGGHVVAQCADQRTGCQRGVGHHQDTAAAPAVGEDPRRHLEDRHDRGIGGGHETDARRVETDLIHEELLHGNPEEEALQECGHIQRTQPLLQWARGLHDAGHDVSSSAGITGTSEPSDRPRHRVVGVRPQCRCAVWISSC